MPHPAEEKKQLRRQLRRARKSLGKSERQTAQTAIVRRLKPLIRRGKRISIYWPAGSEADIRALIRTAGQRRAHIYLPYIQARTLYLWFTPYTPESRRERDKKGRLGIPQFAGKKIRPDRLDTVIVPLLGIDRHGCRIGQGGGYYDCSLGRFRFRRPQTVGVGFACQLLETPLPREPHDILLDGFVSERHRLKFRHRPS